MFGVHKSRTPPLNAWNLVSYFAAYHLGAGVMGAIRAAILAGFATQAVVWTALIRTGIALIFAVPTPSLTVTRLSVGAHGRCIPPLL